MDEISVFEKKNRKKKRKKNKQTKKLETLIQTIKIYSQDIGMEFGIEKCAM